MEAVITIQQLGLEGQGVGRDSDGNLYFVRQTVPGDRVRVQFAPTEKRYRDAELLEVVEKSPDRVDSACRHFPECGACDWLHIEYSAQLKAKAISLAHILKKAELVPQVLHPVLASPLQQGYRNRVQLRVEDGRAGFLKRGSNDLVAIDRCLVAEEKLNDALPEIRRYESRGGRRKVELSATDTGVRQVWDEPHASEGFTQVNRLQNEALKKIVRAGIQRSGAAALLELYCGDGNLSQAVWEEVTYFTGVDVSPPAIEKAMAVCPPSEQKQFLIAPIDGSTWASLPAAFKGRCDTLLLDPPRTGVGKFLGTFLRPSVHNIIYVSCSALTFSWDAKLIVQQGFSLVEIQPLDMFPHTRHLELVAYFSR